MKRNRANRQHGSKMRERSEVVVVVLIVETGSFNDSKSFQLQWKDALLGGSLESGTRISNFEEAALSLFS